VNYVVIDLLVIFATILYSVTVPRTDRQTDNLYVQYTL